MDRKKIILNIFYIFLFYLAFVFVIYPMSNTIYMTFKSDNGVLDLSNYIGFFSSSTNITALKNSIYVGLWTVVICMIVGVFMAFYVEYFIAPFKKTINILMLIPFVLPGVMIVIAFTQLYSEMGMVNQFLKQLFELEKVPIRFSGFTGILFVHGFTQYIYFYINTTIALKFLDHSTVESARSLGATKFMVFKDIIFPHLKPALVTSALLTFITGLSSFSAPYIIGNGYRVLSTQILQSKMNNQMGMASVQVTMLMGISVVIMLLYGYYSKDNVNYQNTKGTLGKKVKVESNFARYAMNIVAFIIVTLTIVPLIGIVVLSFADSSSWMMEIFPSSFGLMNYEKIFLNKRIFAPIENSMVMATLSAFVATLLACLTSYLVIKDKSKKSRLLNIMILLPMAIPASTLGVNLIMAFNKKTPLLFGKSLVGTYYILPIAYILATITVVSRSTFTSFSGFNNEYENASKNLGASTSQTFGLVFVPIVSSGIISGFSLAFMRSIGEYTISALLYGVHNKPLSIAMVNAMHDFDVGISMAYGSIIILLSLVFLSILSKTYISFRD